MDVIHIKLMARNNERNIARYYNLALTNDLLGDWVLVTTYGRIGFRGQSKQYGFAAMDMALSKLETILKKRFNAKTRIGCNYSIASSVIQTPSNEISNRIQNLCQTAKH